MILQTSIFLKSFFLDFVLLTMKYIFIQEMCWLWFFVYSNHDGSTLSWDQKTMVKYGEDIEKISYIYEIYILRRFFIINWNPNFLIKRKPGYQVDEDFT